MATIKEILGDKYSEELEKALNEHIGKGYVAKNDYAAKTGELDALKNAVAERDKRLEELRNSAKGNEELAKSIKELQDQNKAAEEAHAAELKRLKEGHLLDTAVNAAKPKNAKALKALLDASKLVYDGENVKGFDEQIKALKASDPYLFEETATAEPPIRFGNTSNGVPPSAAPAFGWSFASVRGSGGGGQKT
jgi:predicted  nucleic acid-binding Zn-ribbon protein